VRRESPLWYFFFLDHLNEKEYQSGDSRRTPNGAPPAPCKEDIGDLLPIRSILEDIVPMTFARTLFIGIGAWLAAISFLHAYLNWGLFDPQPAEHQTREKFKVGFLPVT
jgi:hypothetical protein